MTSSYERSIGQSLQDAAARIPAPPESRWVPERSVRSGASGAFLAIAGALLIVLFGVAIVSFRPRVVPANLADPFLVADTAAWTQVRAGLPAGVVVLRPTWIPDAFKGAGSADCPSPLVWVANVTYGVSYYSAQFFMPPGSRSNSGCSRIELKTLVVTPADSFYGVQLVDIAPINARGTTVRARIGPRVFDINGEPHQLIYLNWLEGGISYELNTLDVDLVDLTRVLRSLEPMK